MKPNAPQGVLFDAKDFLPAEWASFANQGPVRAFNPGLLRDGAGWLMAQRIVGVDGARRIALCRLDAALKVIPGTPTAFSDHVRFRTDVKLPEQARTWFADPRLYRFGARRFIYWNSGWHEPHNCQFLQELDPDTLRPIGWARECVLDGERQKLEKNWTFFSSASGALHAIYSIAPLRILTFSLEGEADISFHDAFRHEWDVEPYPKSHGGLRGGTPAIDAGGRFWAFTHSVHDDASGYRYAPAAFSFAIEQPFAPLSAPTRWLEFWNPFGGQRVHGRLNPAVGEVIYPCGAAFDGTRWLVSHGINDEHCALTYLRPEDVHATQRPIG